MFKWWKKKSEAERIDLMGWIPATLYVFILFLAAVAVMVNG